MVDFLKKILNISKIFFKNLLSFILFLPKLLTGLIIIAGIVFFLRFSSLDRPIDVEDGSALYIPMEGLIVEEKTSNTDLGDIFFKKQIHLKLIYINYLMRLKVLRMMIRF